MAFEHLINSHPEEHETQEKTPEDALFVNNAFGEFEPYQGIQNREDGEPRDECIEDVDFINGPTEIEAQQDIEQAIFPAAHPPRSTS